MKNKDKILSFLYDVKKIYNIRDYDTQIIFEINNELIDIQEVKKGKYKVSYFKSDNIIILDEIDFTFIFQYLRTLIDTSNSYSSSLS